MASSNQGKQGGGKGQGGTPRGSSNRGFASMDPARQREIASEGGKAAHEKGTAHEWTADEARAAGRKGGQISRGGRGRAVMIPNSTPENVGIESDRVS